MTFNLRQAFIVLTVVAGLCWLYTQLPGDKFTYEQSVIVTDGFFKGQSGTIQDACYFGRYRVRFGGSHYENIHESDLE